MEKSNDFYETWKMGATKSQVSNLLANTLSMQSYNRPNKIKKQLKPRPPMTNI